MLGDNDSGIPVYRQQLNKDAPEKSAPSLALAYLAPSEKDAMPEYVN